MNATHKRAILLIAAVACVSTAGTAWGDGFRMSDNATVTATGHTATVSALSAGVTVDGMLLPGNSITASAKVANPNDFPVDVTGIDDLVVTAESGQRANLACNTTSSKITLVMRDNVGVPAGARGHAVPLTVAMGRNASAACAGAVLTLTFTITADVEVRKQTGA